MSTRFWDPYLLSALGLLVISIACGGSSEKSGAMPSTQVLANSRQTATRLSSLPSLPGIILDRPERPTAKPKLGTRWEAHYTPTYFDNVETLVSVPSTGFQLDDAGSFTSTDSEVIVGKHSIKGSYSGSAKYTPFYQTAASLLLTAGHTYNVTFKYKLLTTPSNGVEVLFYSPTGGSQGDFLPSYTITGTAGQSGTATLTNTLHNFTDYQARWDFPGTGSVSIDEIVLTDVTTGTVVATENAEQIGLGVGNGLQLLDGASITTDSTQVIAGQGSLALSGYSQIVTVPAVVTLAASTTYIIDFDYRILDPGSDTQVLYIWLQPPGVDDQQQWVLLERPLKNSTSLGTFSTGAESATAANYELHIAATGTSSVIVDNIAIYRVDPVSTTSENPSWPALENAPFPRLGRYSFISANTEVLNPFDGIPPFTYRQAELEKRIAFADITVGLVPDIQAQSSAFPRTIKKLNPSAVLLPYRISEEQDTTQPPPYDANISVTYPFQQNFATEWFERTSTGTLLDETDYPGIRPANISSFCPIVNGKTYAEAMLGWLNGTVLSSGLWDGVFFDNLFGRVNPHLPNAFNPALFDVDWNNNGLRDETLASTTEMTRQAAIALLQSLNTQTGGSQLVIGNAGPLPEITLAAYVNGYVFETFNRSWGDFKDSSPNPAMWRLFLDSYRAMGDSARAPAISILEGSSSFLPSPITHGGQITPTADDLRRHRLAMGSALLGDGFYGFDLVGNLSTPYWYDEYSVNADGTAVEDLSAKGYLGHPLTDAVELADAGTLIFHEDFEGTSLPSTFYGDSPPVTVGITNTPGEVISGNGSLFIADPDHTTLRYPSTGTNQGAVPFVPGNTYRVVFDWRVLETLDGNLNFDFGDYKSVYTVPGLVTGDSGTANFPAAMPLNANWSLHFDFLGGGKIAIDNLHVYQGGVGPWRRDFENGFVLVNPYLQPHTFSAADIAGTLNRTHVHRINGTQAPDINNGQPVNGALTLQPLDAVILLADRIELRRPARSHRP